MSKCTIRLADYLSGQDNAWSELIQVATHGESINQDKLFILLTLKSLNYSPDADNAGDYVREGQSLVQTLMQDSKPARSLLSAIASITLLIQESNLHPEDIIEIKSPDKLGLPPSVSVVSA